MKLENIAKLMIYINGDVEDPTDDLIEDILLYNVLCRIILTAEDENAFTPDKIKAIIVREITNCSKQINADGQKIYKAVSTAVLAYRSAWLKSEMEKAMDEILAEMEDRNGDHNDREKFF